MLRAAGRGQTPLGSSEIKVLLSTAQSLKFCRAPTGMGALWVTVPACPQPLGQPRGSPSFGTAPRRWVLQRLGLYLCAGPCRPGFWGPRAPGAPVPLGLAARRRRRQEQLLQLQREGARKGVGITVRAGENTQGATAPWVMCEHIHHPASDPKMGQKKYRAERVRVRISLLLVPVGQVPGGVLPCGGSGLPPRSAQGPPGRLGQ